MVIEPKTDVGWWVVGAGVDEDVEPNADCTGALVDAPNADVPDDCPNADCPNAEVVLEVLPKADCTGAVVDPVPNAEGVLLLAPPPKDDCPKTEPPGALFDAARPNADGCPPANAENAPPPLLLPVPLAPALPEPDAAGLANAEKAPPPPPLVLEPNAEFVAGFPNELWPNADWPKADVVCGAPNADCAAPLAGCPNADAVLPSAGCPKTEVVLPCAGWPNADVVLVDGCPKADVLPAGLPKAD